MNIALKIIQCLKISYDSLYVYRAVHCCDENGDLSDEDILKGLDNILEYGSEHDELYTKLLYKAEDGEENSLLDLDRLSELDNLVGMCCRQRVDVRARFVAFLKRKNNATT